MSRGNRNRKKTVEGFFFPIPLALVLVLAGTLSLTYLWLCGRATTLGKRIINLERQLAEVEKHRLNEEFKWSNMKSPHNIEQALKLHQLDMSWPDKTRVVRLSAPNPASIGKINVRPSSVRTSKSDQIRIAMND